MGTVVTAAELLDSLYFSAESEAEKGTNFERLTKAFLTTDLSWADNT